MVRHFYVRLQFGWKMRHEGDGSCILVGTIGVTSTRDNAHLKRGGKLLGELTALQTALWAQPLSLLESRSLLSCGDCLPPDLALSSPSSHPPQILSISKTHINFHLLFLTTRPHRAGGSRIWFATLCSEILKRTPYPYP